MQIVFFNKKNFGRPTLGFNKGSIFITDLVPHSPTSQHPKYAPPFRQHSLASPDHLNF